MDSAAGNEQHDTTKSEQGATHSYMDHILKQGTIPNSINPGGSYLVGDDVRNEEILRQVDDFVEIAKNLQHTPPENKIPLRPLVYYHVFVSTPVQKVVH